MRNIFQALRDSHNTQRTLLAKLTDTHGDSSSREALFAAVRAELVHHENAEERYFYKPLMEYDMTQETARHSVAEHHEIDELIEALDDTPYTSPAWLNSAKKLQALVLHHLEEEEQEVFQLAGRALSDGAKVALARDYDQMMAAQADNG